MKLNTLTWDDFKQYNPCYDPHERYGDWQGTIIDLLNRDDIPAQDRIWAASQIIDDKTLRLFAVYCARDVAHLMKDERSLNALDVAERYAMGQATDDELAAAWAAAWAAERDAASDAASDAAGAAAGSAAGSAARAAAWAAAMAAASDAASAAASAAADSAASAEARAAASNAAWAAERDAQIKRLILMIQNA